MTRSTKRAATAAVSGAILGAAIITYFATVAAAPLPLGEVTMAVVDCSEVQGNPPGGQEAATCYAGLVACAGEATTPAVALFHEAEATTIGLVVLATGGPGTKLYEDSQTNGQMLADELNARGWATVQIAWPDGWANGQNGFRSLGCRPASLLRWVYEHLHDQAAGPFLALGNSGGSTQIAWALVSYGADEYMDVAILCSGPPHTRLELGCADPCATCETCEGPCGGDDLPCYGPQRQADIDRAWEPENPCTVYDEALLVADGLVDAPGADLDWDGVTIFVIGELDQSGAPPQAGQMFNALHLLGSPICLPGVGHGIADTTTGVEALIAIVETFRPTGI